MIKTLNLQELDEASKMIIAGKTIYFVSLYFQVSVTYLLQVLLEVTSDEK